jgi:hypothetical protein
VLVVVLWSKVKVGLDALDSAIHVFFRSVFSHEIGSLLVTSCVVSSLCCLLSRHIIYSHKTLCILCIFILYIRRTVHPSLRKLFLSILVIILLYRLMLHHKIQ